MIGAVLALAVAAAEPSCVVVYAADVARDVTIKSVTCDTPALENAARAFAKEMLDGGFRDVVALQAPVEIEFSYEEATIQAYADERAEGIL